VGDVVTGAAVAGRLTTPLDVVHVHGTRLLHSERCGR